MAFKIFAITSSGATHAAVAVNEDYGLGHEFSTNEEAKDAMNQATHFTIRGIDKTGRGRFTIGGPHSFIIQEVF